MHFRKVALIGVGLLGGSLGLALRNRRLATTLAGYVRKPIKVSECLEKGAADFASTDLQAVAQDADLVVLCTPVDQMPVLTERVLAAKVLADDAVFTDVGSVKGPLVTTLHALCHAAGVRYVGSHPMAGSDQSGVAAARANLFEGATCVITPLPETDPAARSVVAGMWQAIGGRLLELDPWLHDRLVARTSHLPHVVAAALARHVLDPRNPREQSQLCATGFRDTTRVGSGSPDLWREITLANRVEVSQAIDELVADLQQFRQWLASGEAARVEKFLSDAKQWRDGWIATVGSSARSADCPPD